VIYVLAERHELARIFLRANGIARKDAVVMVNANDIRGRKLDCTVYVVGYPCTEAVVETRRRADSFGGSLHYADPFEKVL
jgi:hypothetical protein